MKQGNIYEFDKNNIISMCISENLKEDEKGEIVKVFMARHGLNQVEMAKLLGLTEG